MASIQEAELYSNMRFSMLEGTDSEESISVMMIESHQFLRLLKLLISGCQNSSQFSSEGLGLIKFPKTIYFEKFQSECALGINSAERFICSISRLFLFSVRLT